MDGNNIIDRYNNIFMKINRAKTVDDIRNIYDEVRKFEVTYKLVDKEIVKSLNDKFLARMKDMLKENEILNNNVKDNIKAANEKNYDYSKEKDESQAVQAKVLELMSKLPKQKSLANTGVIAQLIYKTIKTGTVGSKAVLELLKYPAYVDMVDERFRSQAYTGSKSANQIEFETKKEMEIEKLKCENTQIMLQGFHLRNMQKKFIGSKKLDYFYVDENTDINADSAYFNN